MAYQVLARKYRPQRFSEVIGQEHVTQTLRNAIEQQRIAHGYIFSGHRGIGKTTIARILAMCLNCRADDKSRPEPCGICESCTEIATSSSVDVIEIDAATNRGIDEIRELREATRYRPARDRYKIYILDEAHQITEAAFNALLKTLEEPPPHIVFMMATTQPEDIPQTIRSRCQHFSFRAVRFDDIVDQLKSIANEERVQADDETLGLLAEAGDGSMRDALSLLDQAIACCGSALTLGQVRELTGTLSSEILEKVMTAVARNSSEDVLTITDKLITEGQSPMHFAKQLVRFLRNAVVAKVAGENSHLLQVSKDERLRVARVAKQFAEEDLTRFLSILLRTYDELGYKQEQRFHLELGMMKLVHAQRLLPLEQLLSGASNLAAAGASPLPKVTPDKISAVAAPSPFSSSSKDVARGPSPFESDRARKTRSYENMFSDSQVSPSPPQALAVASTTASCSASTAVAVAYEEEFPSSTWVSAPDHSLDVFRQRIVAALENAGHRTFATMMEQGKWSLSGSELVVSVAASTKVIDMSLVAEVKKLVNHVASSTAGRPIKTRVIPAASDPPSNSTPCSNANGSGGSARLRAATDPVVKRMEEKFGAEIRSVIDYRK